MNEVLKAIAKRRSIRQFDPKQITDAELNAILEAGVQAPSGHNDQSCYFTAIQNAELIKELSDGSKLEMQKSPIPWISDLGKNEKLNIYYNAPTIVIVAAKKGAVSPLADVCAAIENMMIAAVSFNIGSCWIGFSRFFFINAESNGKVEIPADYDVHYAIALGYIPAHLKLTPPARKHDKPFHIIRDAKA